jgi:hypothetical protein
MLDEGHGKFLKQTAVYANTATHAMKIEKTSAKRELLAHFSAPRSPYLQYGSLRYSELTSDFVVLQRFLNFGEIRIANPVQIVDHPSELADLVGPVDSGGKGEFRKERHELLAEARSNLGDFDLLADGAGNRCHRARDARFRRCDGSGLGRLADRQNASRNGWRLIRGSLEGNGS